MKVWGHRTSSCVQKVLWAADELGIPFERTDIGGGYGGLDTAEFTARNPNQVIPVVDDDGFVLWESSAILCYLADRYGAGSLSPADPVARGEAYRWIFWQGSTLRPTMLPLYSEWKSRLPEYRHLTSAQQMSRAAVKVWRIVDDHLAGRQFLAGEEFSAGDIPVGIMAHWWYGFPIEHGDLPNLRAWYERLLARPAFRRRVVDMVD